MGSNLDMTFRAKPVVKRSPRSSWESRDRRNLYLNIGFGIVVLAAILILVIATAVTWYSDHLAPAATVNGQTITIDEYRDRYAIEDWRIKQAKSRVTNQLQSGRLTAAQAESRQQSLDAQRQQLTTIALERLIDTRIQAGLASEEGITVSEADIDARLKTEATVPETRRAWIIEVEPVVASTELDPTPEARAAAKAIADKARADLIAGKSWDEIAKIVSTDAATAPQAGDLGWLTTDDAQADEAYLAAVFEAAVDTPTEVIEGADGIFRIGRVTEIAPETVDALYADKITDDGLDLAKYRAVLAADAIHEKLEAKIVADASKPGPQRRVSELFIAAPQASPPADAIKVRHILYAPNDDPEAAAAGDVPDTDPGWAKAEADARAAWAKIKVAPALFDSIAREESDEDIALGPTGTGGKLPYFDSTSQVDEAFLKAITVATLQAGDLLEPVKSGFGWHVIQVMYRPPDDERMKALKTQADRGTSFAALARDNSEAETSGRGGDLGWIANDQVPGTLSDAIFATAIGKTTDLVPVAGDGLYLFKVIAEEVRTPEGRQLEAIKQSAFSTWYSAKKNAVVITRDATASN